MATFVQLRTEVLNNIIDTPPAIQANVGTYVNRAINDLYAEQNFFDMQSEVVYVTQTLTRALGARPSDWKMARGNPYYLNFSGDTIDLFYSNSKAQLISRYGDNPTYNYGQSQALYEDALSATFWVYPYPDGLSDYSDGQYRITVPYWRVISPLISDSDYNWITTFGDNYIQLQATSYGFYANEDDQRGQEWNQRAETAKKRVKALDRDRWLANTSVLAPHMGALRPQLPENY